MRKKESRYNIRIMKLKQKESDNGVDNGQLSSLPVPNIKETEQILGFCTALVSD